MHLKTTAALCFGLVLFSLAAAPASAQTRQRAEGTRVTTTDEAGRTRTRIVVQRRSFLDGGTEVLPGSQATANNVIPFGYSPWNTPYIEGTNFGRLRQPLPSFYDLMGKDNPYPYQW